MIQGKECCPADRDPGRGSTVEDALDRTRERARWSGFER
jgi:hypothetical protein